LRQHADLRGTATSRKSSIILAIHCGIQAISAVF
jgi:hypothetical protein